VHDEDFQYDEGSKNAIDSNNQARVMVKTLEDLRGKETTGAPRRLHLHFFSSPVEVLGTEGKVSGIKIERTELDGTGNVKPNGEFRQFPIQAIYRAVGYFGSELTEIPFDSKAGVIPNDKGRVLDSSGTHIKGVYATGWIKRGPVGLIGHTKSDAIETIAQIIEDKNNWWNPEHPEESSVAELLQERKIEYVGWPNWLLIDAEEKRLGSVENRERVKLVERNDFMKVSKGESV
jgi:ferredoxin--NADP+ reductase